MKVNIIHSNGFTESKYSQRLIEDLLNSLGRHDNNTTTGEANWLPSESTSSTPLPYTYTGESTFLTNIINNIASDDSSDS